MWMSNIERNSTDFSDIIDKINSIKIEDDKFEEILEKNENNVLYKKVIDLIIVLFK